MFRLKLHIFLIKKRLNRTRTQKLSNAGQTLYQLSQTKQTDPNYAMPPKFPTCKIRLYHSIFLRLSGPREAEHSL